MTSFDIKSLDIDGLLALRAEIENQLSERRRELEAQLSRLDADHNSGHARRATKKARPGRRTSAMKGRKVPPKYRDSEGNVWAGRGAEPRWMRDAIKAGKKREDFLIDNQHKRGKQKS